LSHMRKGGLHRALGVAEGTKIPAAKKRKKKAAKFAKQSLQNR